MHIFMLQCVLLLLFAEKGTIMKNININEKKPIKVTIHVPENVSSAVKQRKINRLYDLLKPPEDDKAGNKAG